MRAALSRFRNYPEAIAEIFMKHQAMPIRPGIHFLSGNEAVSCAALVAGCRFMAGYPITPATEIMEHFAEHAPLHHALFIQLEDELATSMAILGASWAGKKAMTATSGPGFSLMAENIGYAVATETPVVIVNVQRGGPSTGLPTLPAQGDMMQARFGSHGDYGIIALVPSSVQECFDLTVKAFSLAEQYRTPVLLMMDEVVAHMTERFEIPELGKLSIIGRIKPRRHARTDQAYEPFRNGMPEMAAAGQGHSIHMTGLTHNEQGEPDTTPQAQAKLVSRLCQKIEASESSLRDCIEYRCKDAELIVVAYGITARAAMDAVSAARKMGLRVGLLKLRTIWPFPEKKLAQLASSGASFLTVEMNLGQIALEIERSVAGRSSCVRMGQCGGQPFLPEQILKKIQRLL